jgi:hypothetical protein
MKAVTVLDYLRRFLSRVQQLSDKSRENLLDDAARRLEGRELEGEDDDIFKQNLHFQVLRGDLVESNWSSLTPEERIYIMFPAARSVGEEVEIPKRGKGKVLWRELTPRLGLKIGFEMSDGNKWAWEFFD